VPVPSLRSILATPLHSPWAVPLGCSVGALTGGAVSLTFSLAFRSCANIVPDALIGGWLGIGWTNVQRYLDPGKAMAPLQPHERALVDYPGVRQLLHDAGTSVDDLDALKRLADQLERDFSRVTGEFNAYCRSRQVPPNPLIGGVIRHFCLTHFRDRAVMLVAKRSATACYLVAAREGQAPAIGEALNREGTRAGTVLRQLHCPYLRVDLANSALRDAQAFTTDEREGEMRVHSLHDRARETVETLATSPLVDVTHRRLPRRRYVNHASAAPVADIPAPAGADRERVIRGPLLRAKIAGLPAGNRTCRELRRIEQDLAANRPCGHPVRYQGRNYLAIDIHFAGRQSPGRNVWRLLHRKGPAGHELVDIVDYHDPRS